MILQLPGFITGCELTSTAAATTETNASGHSQQQEG